MNKIPYLFTKNYLLVLVGLFFVSTFALDPLFHEASEDDHSNLECHFCLNEISDATFKLKLAEEEDPNKIIFFLTGNFFSVCTPG